MRERLANRRSCETFNIVCNKPRLYRQHRPLDGRLAEIFVSNGKSGSDADAAAKDSAVVCSIALQHGVPVETIRRALLRDARDNPSSPLGTALDLLARAAS